ncbi:unnamed protein product, partial [Prorocentrum cordatum]
MGRGGRIRGRGAVGAILRRRVELAGAFVDIQRCISELCVLADGVVQGRLEDLAAPWLAGQ